MAKLLYGISEALGWRETMEDTHEAGEHLGVKLFAPGVYNGHDGALAARIATQVLTLFFLLPHERPFPCR